MTTRPVERRHREVARAVLQQIKDARSMPLSPRAIDVVSQALADAEQPALSAPADPGESPSFGLETWRGPLGLVRLVLRGREHVGYRALGPMQQMPREDFERVFIKCVSPTIKELKVKSSPEFDPWEALCRWSAGTITDDFVATGNEPPTLVTTRRGEEMGHAASGATFREAALNLCRKLGLTESPKGKENNHE